MFRKYRISLFELGENALLFLSVYTEISGKHSFHRFDILEFLRDNYSSLKDKGVLLCCNNSMHLFIELLERCDAQNLLLKPVYVNSCKCMDSLLKLYLLGSKQKQIVIYLKK